MSKEPPSHTGESKDLVPIAKTQRGEPGIRLQILIFLYPPAENRKKQSPARKRHQGVQDCKKLGLKHRSKEPETPPTERALRTAPVSKEPPATREQGPRAHCKNPEG